MRRLLDAAAVLALLVAAGTVLSFLVGCSAPQDAAQDAKTVIDSTAQQAELAQCRAIGRQHNSFEEYAVCADRVDAHYLDGGR